MTNPADASGVEGDLERLFALSLDLMCVAGLDGFFKRVNPAFERVLGYPREELLAHQFIEFVHEDDRASTLAEVASLAEGSPTVDFENRYRTASGEYRWLAWRAAPMPERGLIFAVARDVTEHKRDAQQLARQAEELARSNADLEQFAYAASHDLRAPIRSIITLAGFVEQDLVDSLPAATKEHLQQLRRRAQLMRALIDDLLVFSQTGSRSGKVTRVDVAELVREATFLLDPPPGFEVVGDSALPVFETAHGPLRQVLRNLVANALKHHDRDSGRVTVTARDAGEFWEFAVADDGPGIRPEDRDRVANAFSQLTGASPTEGMGMGMGLAIVGRIVGSQGGRIQVDCAAHRGATFRFSWPKEVAATREP